jgi:predicted O-methyltransferase YrrM
MDCTDTFCCATPGAVSTGDSLSSIAIPDDLDAVLDEAWDAAKRVPGFLLESEGRFLGMAAACLPTGGAIVEIGSFKGKSTVMLAKVSQRYGLGRVVAIDPHNFNSTELQSQKSEPDASTFGQFLENIRSAGVEDFVDVHRTYSKNVSPTWTSPIRFLWIDGDHSYAGAKTDYEGFLPHLNPEGIVAFHDALHEFSGPIRVFVEDVLRSDSFGAAGFVGSIAWSQFTPQDGRRFQKKRTAIERVAAPLIPYVQSDTRLRGLRKLRYKFNRSRVPRALMSPTQWAAHLAGVDLA